MKIIKLISEKIEDELNCAEEYAKLAIKEKDQYPEVAKTFYDLSLIRMQNIKSLHDRVVTIINNYRATQGDPPAPMMAIYDYLHERQIDQSMGVKKLQQMFKTN